MRRLVIDGFGQLELNQVAFRRDGRIEAQCKIAEGIDYVENGMILAINKAAGTVGYPTGAAGELLALNYTTEHMYDERHQGLKDFKLERGSFLPRLGFLAIGDRFTTNCLSYDTEEFANDNAVKDAIAACATTPIYGIPSTDGSILVTANKGTASVVLQVAKKTTMPDGQFAAKFVVVKA